MEQQSPLCLRSGATKGKDAVGEIKGQREEREGRKRERWREEEASTDAKMERKGAGKEKRSVEREGRKGFKD
eukprot:760529-Hanusia_phi.AAC.2